MSAAKSLGAIIIIALAWGYVAGQTSQPTASPESSGPPATGTISGQVVDENEQPVPNAEIQISALRSTANNSTQRVISDRNGEFLITGLQPVDYGIVATASSYMVARNEWPRPSGYRIGDRVRLKMIRGGVVTGKVTDENGNPVVGVGVRALMVRDTAGRLLPRGNSFYKATDDRGVYRIYGLWPGLYVVVAGGPESLRSYEQTTFELDVPTYAPSSTRDTAEEYIVRAGEEVSDINIRYRGEQGRVISGEVTVPSNLYTGFSVTLASGSDIGFPLSTTSNRGSSRSFIFKGVGDGEYKLFAHSSNTSGEIAISEAKSVSVRGADAGGIKLTANLLGSVSGRVVVDETKVAGCTGQENPLAYAATVVAAPGEIEGAKQVPQLLQNLWSLGDPVRLDSENKFLLQNIIPGAYHFRLNFHAPQWYVNSIAFTPAASPASPNTKAKPVDAANVWTNVKGSERLTNLTITLTHGAALLRGNLVLADGEKVPEGLTIYLVPVEPSKANDALRYFAEPVRSNGYIGISSIAPGRYWILAQPAEGVDSSQAKLRLPSEIETRKRLRRDAEALKNEIELKPCQDMSDFKLPLRTPTQN